MSEGQAGQGPPGAVPEDRAVRVYSASDPATGQYLVELLARRGIPALLLLSQDPYDGALLARYGGMYAVLVSVRDLEGRAAEIEAALAELRETQAPDGQGESPEKAQP